MPSEINDSAIGTIYDDRFQIEAVLGQGGMGTVYLARQLQMDRMVALKIMRAHSMSDAQTRERFSREIKAAGGLDHPNIVKPIASGFAADGSAFVAMELLEGTPLSKIIEAEGKIPAERALPILIDIAAALAEAHSHGIMHRDIKPSNVMIVRDQSAVEHAKIIDFGLAKEVTQLVEGQTQTATTMAGSPLYMSPEQCEQKRTDARTDIYSFGCLMYDVLRGEPPFNGDSAYVVLYQHLHDAPPPLEKSVPDYLRAIAAKCLLKNPQDRFNDGQELLQALEAQVWLPVQKQRPAKNSKLPIKALAFTGAILAVTPVIVATIMLLRAQSDPSVLWNTAAVMDGLRLYAQEAQLYDTAAQNFLNAGPLPAPAQPATGNLPLAKQERLLTYIKMRIAATEARAKSDPSNASTFIEETLRWFRENYIDGCGNFYLDQKLYDNCVLTVCRLPLLLEDPTRGDSSLQRELGELGNIAMIRAYWAPDVSLLQPAIAVCEISAQMLSRVNSESIIRDYNNLFLGHLSAYALAKSEPEKAQELLLMAKYNQLEMAARVKNHSGPDLLAVCRSQSAAVALAQGDEKKAAEILDQAFRECMLAIKVVRADYALYFVNQSLRAFVLLKRADFIAPFISKYGLDNWRSIQRIPPRDQS